MDGLRLDVLHKNIAFEIAERKKAYGELYAEQYPLSAAEGETSNGMSVDQLKLCFDFMSTLTVSLLRGSERVAGVVGREVQGLLYEYLDSMPAALRVGLGLNEVHVEVEKRAARLHEPSAEIVQKRAALLKRKRELDDVG